MASAPCRKYPVDVFFPPRGQNALQAKLICAGCDHRAECLEYALDVCDPDGASGVYGGLSPVERRGMRSSRPNLTAPACGTTAAYQRHIRRGEEPCEPCRKARRDDKRLREALKRASA
jgi:hypothetical protein